jgi:hypothetical protein
VGGQLCFKIRLRESSEAPAQLSWSAYRTDSDNSVLNAITTVAGSTSAPFTVRISQISGFVLCQNLQRCGLKSYQILVHYGHQISSSCGRESARGQLGHYLQQSNLGRRIPRIDEGCAGTALLVSSAAILCNERRAVGGTV